MFKIELKCLSFNYRVKYYYNLLFLQNLFNGTSVSEFTVTDMNDFFHSTIQSMRMSQRKSNTASRLKLQQSSLGHVSDHQSPSLSRVSDRQSPSRNRVSDRQSPQRLVRSKTDEAQPTPVRHRSNDGCQSSPRLSRRSMTSERRQIPAQHLSNKGRSSQARRSASGNNTINQESVPVSDSDSDGDVSVRTGARKYISKIVAPELIEYLTQRWTCVANAFEPDDDSDMALSEVGTLETILLLLTVLKNVVHEDIQYSTEQTACMYLMPRIGQLLITITELVYRSHETNCSTNADNKLITNFNTEELVLIGRCIVRVVALTALRLSAQIDGLTVLHRDCVLDNIFSVLYDRLRNSDCTNPQQLLLASEFIVASWIFMEGMLSNYHLNDVVIGATLKALNGVVRGCSLDVLQTVLLKLDLVAVHSIELVPSTFPAKKWISRILGQVVKVVELLKSVRACYLHWCICRKTRHIQCNLTNLCRHHHDILGVSISASTLSRCDGCSDELTKDGSNVCIIAKVTEILLNVYQKASSSSTRSSFLDTMQRTKVCCCMSPYLITKRLLDKIEFSNIKLRRRALCVLVHTLLDDLGGKEMTSSQDNLCIACTDPNYSPQTVCRRSTGGWVNSVDVPCRWDGVAANLLTCVTCCNVEGPVLWHALKLAVEGNDILRYKLFIDLFMPLLLSASHVLLKHNYSSPECQTPFISSDRAPLIVHYCLAALQKLIVIRDAYDFFIRSHGVDLLVKLAALSKHRMNSLKLLSILVMFDELPATSQSPIKLIQQVDPSLRADGLDEGTTKSDLSVLAALVYLIFEDWTSETINNEMVMVRLSDMSILNTMTDMWDASMKLMMHNERFREAFVMRNGHKLSRMLLTIGAKLFLCSNVIADSATTEVRMAVFSRASGPFHIPGCWLALTSSALSICLRCCLLNIPFDQEVSVIQNFFILRFLVLSLNWDKFMILRHCIFNLLLTFSPKKEFF